MPAGYQSLSTMSKPQRGGFNQLLKQLQSMLSSGTANIQQNPLFQQGSNYISGLMDPSSQAMKSFEAPAMRQFNEQIIPGIAERFSGLGAGAQSSSAFQQALGQAGAGLSERLQQMRSGLQMSGAQQGLQYAQQPFQNLLGLGQLGFGTQSQGFAPKNKPFWQELLLGGSQGASQLLSMLPFLL